MQKIVAGTRIGNQIIIVNGRNAGNEIYQDIDIDVNVPSKEEYSNLKVGLLLHDRIDIPFVQDLPHYENMPIQIYRKYLRYSDKIYSDKKC